MPHITLPEGVPGIIGPLMQYPETAQPLNALAETLLRGPSSLTPAERELIAAYTSNENDCYFCTGAHSAAATYLFDYDRSFVDQVFRDFETAPISDKMKALLNIARKVQRGGRNVSEEDVARARAAGADDRAIHDTVLTAAAFCMFNRYVDGLATLTPRDPAVYDEIGEMLGTRGYLNSVPQ